MLWFATTARENVFLVQRVVADVCCNSERSKTRHCLISGCTMGQAVRGREGLRGELEIAIYQEAQVWRTHCVRMSGRFETSA